MIIEGMLIIVCIIGDVSYLIEFFRDIDIIVTVV